MSQEKVDRYKEQKKNRKKIMKQEKCKRYLGYTATVVVIALIIGWAGFSIYKNHEANKKNHFRCMRLGTVGRAFRLEGTRHAQRR